MFREGDVVHLKRHGDESLWKIDSLGEAEYYDNGAALSEEPTDLSLFLPAPGRARCSYPKKEWAHRDLMIHVAAMEVIARTVAAVSESKQNELEARWKQRVRRWRQLRMQAQTFKKHRERVAAKKRLREFEKKNYDLVRVFRGD